MHLLLTFILSLLLISNGAADEGRDPDQCAAVKEKIRHIQSRMRAGYTRAQGERMEARLRKLRQQRKSRCK